MEIWRDISGYISLYQVSDLGRVKSLPRVDSLGRKNFGRILSFGNNNGYLNVRLYKNGNSKSRTVHQLVAEGFKDFIPNGYKSVLVNHINFNKRDNRAVNLEIITPRENSNQKHLPSTSKYVGVCWDKGSNKWASYIHYNGKQIRLGRFANEYDAHLAYQKALKGIAETL